MRSVNSTVMAPVHLKSEYESLASTFTHVTNPCSICKTSSQAGPQHTAPALELVSGATEGAC